MLKTLVNHFENQIDFHGSFFNNGRGVYYTPIREYILGRVNHEDRTKSK